MANDIEDFAAGADLARRALLAKADGHEVSVLAFLYENADVEDLPHAIDALVDTVYGILRAHSRGDEERTTAEMRRWAANLDDAIVTAQAEHILRTAADDPTT